MSEVEKPTVEKPQGEKAVAKIPFWQRGAVVIVGTLVLGLALFWGLDYLVKTFTHESTDDATLEGDVVSIAPRVAGQVKKVNVRSNQRVAAGEPLVVIDPQDLQAQLEHKQTAVESAKANVGLMRATVDLFRSEIATAEATAKQSAAGASAAEANTEKARADFRRAEELIANKTISPQEFDAAKAAVDWAEANLKSQREKAASDAAKVGQSQAQLTAGVKAYERAEAQAKEAEADAQPATLNLSYAKVTAPEEGYVTKKAVEAGDYVQVGQRLMALVPAKGLYVIANFKETQLQNVRVGQPVEVDIDSVNGGPFAGHVESMQAGSGARFSLLPPENAVGNFVKVVQRVPVKIVFDKPLEAVNVLGPGMSVVPWVRVTSFNVPGVVVALVAAVIALAVGVIWGRAAKGKRA